MKLHLGCGQNYLSGYVNIDFPSSEHSVQKDSIADQHADILTLKYAPESIDEIRLHHVFEHFQRPVACALLASWFAWLKPGGRLHIEVPDFQKSARAMLNPLSSFRKQAMSERHLFGSHEAHWAIHCEGYTPRMLGNMLERFGFQIIKKRKISWKGIYNFELLAKKQEKNISKSEFEQITRSFLSNYLIDQGDSETRLLEVWMQIYNNQLNKCWIQNG